MYDFGLILLNDVYVHCTYLFILIATDVGLNCWDSAMYDVVAHAPIFDRSALKLVRGGRAVSKLPRSSPRLVLIVTIKRYGGYGDEVGR